VSNSAQTPLALDGTIQKYQRLTGCLDGPEIVGRLPTALRRIYVGNFQAVSTNGT